MSDERFRNAVEAALFAAGRPLGVDDLVAVFADSEWQAERSDVRSVLAALAELWQERGLELVEVGSGWRFQVRREYSAALGRLWSDKPPRYSRALLETLAIIAYRQPVTRGEIEDIRGVAVSPSILKTLQERDWIRTLGHKEVPGRPELLGSTRQFLDDFGLQNLESLPPLAEIRDLDSMPDDLFPETRQGEATADGQTVSSPQAAGAADVAGEGGESGAEDASPLADSGDESADAAGEPADAAGDDEKGPATDPVSDPGRAASPSASRESTDARQDDDGEDDAAGTPAEDQEDRHGPSSTSTS